MWDEVKENRAVRTREWFPELSKEQVELASGMFLGYHSMTLQYQWRGITDPDEIIGCVFGSPTYSPSGKFMMDYNSMHCSRSDIVIVNFETSSIRLYGSYLNEYICCFYWLNDYEIVVITQGCRRYNREVESVFYNLYKLDHENGKAIEQIRWKYLLPRSTKTLTNFPTLCSTPIIIKGIAFCVFQVGGELVLLPWDVRSTNPSYSPIRIEIQNAYVGEMKLKRPMSHGRTATWCNFYCFDSSIYLELENTLENPDISYDRSIFIDRLFRLDLAQIDLTSRKIIINSTSSEWSIQRMERSDPTDNEPYQMTEYTQQIQHGKYVLKTRRWPETGWRQSHDEQYADMCLINLKEKKVSKEKVEYKVERAGGSVFTILHNKYVDWRYARNRWEFRIQPSRHLPRHSSLYQMCWEKAFLCPTAADIEPQIKPKPKKNKKN